MKNQMLKQVFATDTAQNKFIVSVLERLAGDDVINEVLAEMMPQAPTSQEIYLGRTLSFYSGLSRLKLIKLVGLTNEQVDEVYSKLGVQESEESKAEAQAELSEASNDESAREPVKVDNVKTESASQSEDEFSYATLIKKDKAELLGLAKERGVEVNEDLRESQIASAIAKDAKAKASA